MARRYSKEVHEFIAANVKGHTTKELVLLVNEQFNLGFTERSMKSYKTNHKLRSGTPCGKAAGTPSKVFPAHVVTYITENHVGCGPTEMAARLNAKFGTNYNASQLKGYYGNHHLNSGVTGYFEKGGIPYNKGKKGVHAAGSEKGWFSKGNTPANKLPIGTVLMKSDGYLWRKLGEGSRDWKQEHRLVWEAVHGAVPDGHILIFKDGDRMNCALENLAMISLAENAQMNTRKLRSNIPEHTETGILIAKIHNAAKKRS